MKMPKNSIIRLAVDIISVYVVDMVVESTESNSGELDRFAG